MRRIHGIIVHCTATRPDFMRDSSTRARVAEIRRWHVQDRGWSDIGYHYLIDRDGTVVEGRPLARTGAHVAGHNTGTVGISLFGGHGSNENDLFDDHFTQKQERSLVELILRLQDALPGAQSVTGHNQYSAKACPGFDAEDWWAEKKSFGQERAEIEPGPVAPPVGVSPATSSRKRLSFRSRRQDR